jgi:hypothetical protein
MELLLGIGLIVGSVMLLRARQVSVRMPEQSIRPEEAARTYQDRIHATDVLLREGRLDSDGI